MADKEKLMGEFESGFEKMKKELGFKSGLAELDRIFFLKDGVLKVGFVSDGLSRQVCSRIIETYMSWNNYLHGLIMPHPQNILNLTESKAVKDEADRKKISGAMKMAMELASRNTLIGLTKDKKEEAKFIDDAVRIWDKEFSPLLKEIMKKINESWKE